MLSDMARPRVFVPPPPARDPGPVFITGLDLGQIGDFTALATVERTEVEEGGKKVRHFAGRHLVRWPLKTSYTSIVKDVVELFERPPLSGSVLCVDATG